MPPYVRDTAVSFEYEVPSQEEFARRIARTLEKYPYLAAQREGELLGYACTGPFVGRAAYGWAAETSIYLRQDCRRQGAGRALYPPWRPSPGPSTSPSSTPASAPRRRRTST